MYKYLILFAFITPLAACDVEPDQTVDICTQEHIETMSVIVCGGMGAASGGIPIGGDCHVVLQTNTICDNWITKHNPEWDVWKAQHEAKLAAKLRGDAQ